MEAMRVNWTDDRLGERFDHVDESFKQIDQRFDRVETDIRELRGDMDQGFSQMRVEMNGRFDRLDARFDGMQRALFLSAAGIVAALIGVIATQL
jgi:hypothetical protein